MWTCKCQFQGSNDKFNYWIDWKIPSLGINQIIIWRHVRPTLKSYPACLSTKSKWWILQIQSNNYCAIWSPVACKLPLSTGKNAKSNGFPTKNKIKFSDTNSSEEMHTGISSELFNSVQCTPLYERPEIVFVGGWLITRCPRLLKREQRVFLIVSDSQAYFSRGERGGKTRAVLVM